MKTFYLLVISVIISSVSFSQENKNMTPGDELVLASKLYYSGFTAMVVGTSVALLAPNIMPYSKHASESAIKATDQDRNAIRIAFGSVAIVGLIIQTTSFIHIKRAGDKLNLISGVDGLGIALKF